MRAVITGGAGFIGSNLVDRLLATRHEVVAYDNLSTGQERFLEQARTHPCFTFVRGDVLDLAALTTAVRGADVVFHFAANADVRYGTEHPERDLQQNTVGTFQVLEAMRAHQLAPDARVVILSSKDDERTLVRGYELKADEFFMKPVDPDVVAHKISALIEAG